MKLGLSLGVTARRGGGVLIRVAVPSVTSPADDATDIGETPTITTSAFAVTNEGLDTHASTDWQIASDAGFSTIVIQSLADTSNKTSWTVPSGQLTESTEYFVRARHNGTTYGASGWSATVSFTTASAFSYTWTNAEGEAFAAAMSGTYSDAKLALLDTYISNLKSGLTNGTNTWGGHDVLSLLFLDNATDGLRWFNSPATLMTNNGATHTPGEGYTGNGSSSYIDTGYNPAVDGVQLTLNSLGMGIWVRAVGTSSPLRVFCGAVGAAGAGSTRIGRQADGTAWFVNTAGGTIVASTSSESATGLLSANRSAASAQQAYRNGALEASDSDASSSIPSRNLFLLASNSDGAPASHSNGQISIFRAGRSFTAAEWADIYAADNALLTAWAAA
ncbi:MAG: hypothetical protein VX529_08140 [Pseudomonadota bacterium]|nr:hypothetical protein [Pseudomonadota bacterium]